DEDHQRGGHGGDRDGRLLVVHQALGNDQQQHGDQRLGHVVQQQDQADQPVGPLQQAARQGGSAMARLHQVPQPVAVQRHQACFGAGEEGRQQEEDQQ